MTSIVSTPSWANLAETFINSWCKLVRTPIDPNNKNSYILFQKRKLNLDECDEITSSLMNSFLIWHDNIYILHLHSIEYCMRNQEKTFLNADKSLAILYLNKTFIDWHRQQVNKIKKNATKNGEHIMQSCTDLKCMCVLDGECVKLAFEIATVNMALLSSFNKIYKFKENISFINEKIEQFLRKTNSQQSNYDTAKLINELDLYDSYPHIIDLATDIYVPLMLEDKYDLIDELVVNSEKALLSLAACVNDLCSPKVNLKRVAQKPVYLGINQRGLNKFTSAKLAKYVMTHMKRGKKLTLVTTSYPNLAFACKLSQLRYIINLKYSNFDPISDEAWRELLVDLVGDDQMLRHQLIANLVEIRKDVKATHLFLDVFGHGCLDAFPVSLKEFFYKNIAFMGNNSGKSTQLRGQTSSNGDCIENGSSNYYTSSLDITFVDNSNLFTEMLCYFETIKPSIIGMDCEWKPIFDQEESEPVETKTNMNDQEENTLATTQVETMMDKKNRPSTLQIATRDKVFIIETKSLVDTLDDELILKFGELVLFSDTLVKLGYGFAQDGKKLANSFPAFKYRFVNFVEDVINMDEIAEECRKINPKIFDTPHVAMASKGPKPKGLSKLTMTCLGKPLDKRECMSNWDNKPLRQAQLNYAALDAFVLIQIHDFIQMRCKELNVNFDYTSKNLI